jgi:hypothetical protein
VLKPIESDDPGWHRFATVLDDKPFDVEVSARRAASADDAQRLADALYPRVVNDAWLLTEQCATDLLDDYNEEWSDGDELDADAFRSRLSLRGFGVMPDGHVRARFSDGDLFGGHDVVVDTDPELRPLTTILEG